MPAHSTGTSLMSRWVWVRGRRLWQGPGENSQRAGLAGRPPTAPILTGSIVGWGSAYDTDLRRGSRLGDEVGDGRPDDIGRIFRGEMACAGDRRRAHVGKPGLTEPGNVGGDVSAFVLTPQVQQRRTDQAAALAAASCRSIRYQLNPAANASSAAYA